MKLKNLLMMTPLIVLMLVTSAFGGMRYTEILQVPWGENEAELRPGSYPGLQTGPLSFQIKGETIIIYDAENKKLKRFGPSGYISSEEIPMNYMLDFHYNGDDLYLMGQHNIYQRKDGQWKQIAEQEELKYMFMGFHESENTVIARHPEGDLALGLQRFNKPAKLSPRVTRSLPSRVHIDLGYKNIDLHVPNVGSVDYIGSAPGGKHYIYAESITRQVPLAVARYIYLVDENGKVHARIILPRQQFSYIFKEFTVGPQGELYHMHSAREGICIIRWEYDPDGKGTDLVYPDRFSEVYHFNGYSEAEPAIANPPLNKNTPTAATSVERTETLEIADAHVRHVWTATAANIGTTSTVTTPEWIQVGQNVSIPYKWGGWNTIAQFDAGIAAGKLAGDKNTSVVDWGNSVGNDCSGYVSICWKTSQKYGTSTISNVSRQLSSVNDLLPGDATNKAGSHIRLFVEWTNDGKLLQAEATGSGWLTRYYTWTVSGITGYVPIRYNNIQGMQAPRPTLLYAVTEGDSVDLA